MPPIKSGTVVFQVDGAFITDLARDMWTEGDKPQKAINLLVNGYSGMTEEVAIKILTGKLKLVGINEKTKAVEDNATHAPNGNKLLSVAETLGQEKKKQEVLDERLRDLIYPRVLMASPWGQILVPQSIAKKIERDEDSFDNYNEGTFETRREAWHRWRELVRVSYRSLEHANGTNRRPLELLSEELDATEEDYEAAEGGDVPPSAESDGDGERMRKLGMAVHADMAILSALGDKAQVFLEARDRFLAGYGKDDDTPPEADPTLSSPWAWIDRDGNFYPCDGYAGHISLAGRFGKTEGQMEEEGWLKLCRGDTAIISRDWDFSYRSKIRMTDAQWRVVEDWCMKHQRPIPEPEELDKGE
jgi:hypothetical protein